MPKAARLSPVARGDSSILVSMCFILISTDARVMTGYFRQAYKFVISRKDPGHVGFALMVCKQKQTKNIYEKYNDFIELPDGCIDFDGRTDPGWIGPGG